jgi:hypothetical protein
VTVSPIRYTRDHVAGSREAVVYARLELEMAAGALNSLGARYVDATPDHATWHSAVEARDHAALAFRAQLAAATGLDAGDIERALAL